MKQSVRASASEVLPEKKWLWNRIPEERLDPVHHEVSPHYALCRKCMRRFSDIVVNIKGGYPNLMNLSVRSYTINTKYISLSHICPLIGVQYFSCCFIPHSRGQCLENNPRYMGTVYKGQLKSQGATKTKMRGRTDVLFRDGERWLCRSQTSQIGSLWQRWWNLLKCSISKCYHSVSVMWCRFDTVLLKALCVRFLDGTMIIFY